ncbi:MAG: DUF262 domain-containing protein [Lachnospiraceae bacterium]|nr:DUF262 domain-containing protein [bacterium]MDY5517176.1 DUF262 domain-containing protein [Lachnospiraceae bacterium]
MEKDIYTFYELVEQYKVKIPILQRDYAQGREENISICENFLKALRESILQNKTINLDFIYGNVDDGTFLPLDGQQRLTTLFLLHWYAFEKEYMDDCRETLKKFSYETRLSARRFCEALLDNRISVDSSEESISEQILDAKWFYLSWKQDPTIRAMLRSIDLIHTAFKEVNDLWLALVNRRNIVFHLLILENFGLSDDLYIKMNARGRLLTPFENLKAEIQDKAIRENWELSKEENEKFSYRIDGVWTDFLWQNYNKNNTIDNAHMNFITTLVMTKLPVGRLVKGAERIDIIRRLNFTNAARELINYIDQEVFGYICEAYALYSDLTERQGVPPLNVVLWRHAPEKDLLNQILLGSNTSYSHKVLFYAQTRYLMSNPTIRQDKYEEWMRVVRNIVSRADITPDGKRNDIIRSPETFNGAIGLVNELAHGCDDIYAYLCSASISSTFAREQVKEEVLKSKIIQKYPEYKELLFKTEDNELLRGRITFALQCAGYETDINEIDFEMLKKVKTVLARYFNSELESENTEFDKFRRAMLTIEVSGKYQYYNYWWSYWNAAAAEKRKLFPAFREIEYFIGLDDYNVYFKKLILKLTQADYDSILANFMKPDNMENWQYRLIVEEDLLSNCTSKYIAISPDRKFCYLMRSKRPSDTIGSMKVE